MRFGIREICDVVLRAKSTQTLGSRTFYKNEPVLYFDTLKTSSLEGSATTVYAQGGRGNSRLIAWEGERTLTFTMEDALLSMESFSILSGAGLIAATSKAPLYVHQTSQIEVTEDNTIVLPEGVFACWNGFDKDDSLYKDAADIFVMVLKDGEVNAEPCKPLAVDNKGISSVITCYSHSGKLEKDTIVLVDYYVKRTSGASMIEITPDKFGGYYYLEASTLFRREADGVDMPAEFIIPRCKVQSSFNFSMAATGDPSTFTFTLDAFPDYTKFDKTHKVLAAIQVIDEMEEAEDDKGRLPCDNGLVTDFKQKIQTSSDDVVVVFADNGPVCSVTLAGKDVENAVPAPDDTFGNYGATNVGVVIRMPLPVIPGVEYTIEQTNPALKYFKDLGDNRITEADGQYTKSSTYTFTEEMAKDNFEFIASDTPDEITVVLKRGSVVDKTYTFSNNIKFTH